MDGKWGFVSSGSSLFGSSKIRGCRAASHQRRSTFAVRPKGAATRMSTGDGQGSPAAETEKNDFPQLPRKLLIGLSSMGFLETSFLTYKKLFGGGVASLCSSAGCLEVLGGPYSTVFGIPLTLFGMGGYALALMLSSYPLLVSDDNEARLRDAATRGLLVSLVSAMATFSAYLLFVLFGVIQGWCPWCIASAALSSAMGIAVLAKSIPSRWRESLSSVVVTMIAAAGIFVTTPGGIFDASVIRDPLPITTESTVQSLKLSEELRSKDTKMYGAFWCSHCFAQKQLLGKEAMEKIKYIECAERGRNSQADLCREKRIPGYPAWEIDGKLYFGEQSLEDFDEIIRTGQKANDPYADLLKELEEDFVP